MMCPGCGWEVGDGYNDQHSKAWCRKNRAQSGRWLRKGLCIGCGGELAKAVFHDPGCCHLDWSCVDCGLSSSITHHVTPPLQPRPRKKTATKRRRVRARARARAA